MSTEHTKWRSLVAPYLQGNGAELATGGDPIVPGSIQFELPARDYAIYNSNQPLRGPVQWRSADAIWHLPFKDGVLDYLASSHLLEDFIDWAPLLREWVRVLRPGGRLVLCVPEKGRWAAALARGQNPNNAHRREPVLGEITLEVKKLKLPLERIEERFTEMPPGDYNLLWTATKLWSTAKKA